MAVPPFPALMRPALEVLAEGPTSLGGLHLQLAKTLNMTLADVALKVASGKTTRLKVRVNWAATYLVHAGLLSRPERGWLEITPSGRKVLAAGPAELTKDWLFENFPSSRRLAPRRFQAAALVSQ